MASASSSFRFRHHALLVVLLLSLTRHSESTATTGRRLMELYRPPPADLLRYHNGAVLSGDIPVSILWYGRFTPAQKAVVSDFLLSLSAAPGESPAPSVSQWWSTIDRMYLSKALAAHPSVKYGGGGGGGGKNARAVLAGQVSDEGCSLGRSLKLSQLPVLAARARPAKGGVALVLTAQDVAVEGFCMSRCGTHGAVDARARTAYAWVGNPAAQCPGQCAWPFHQPPYGPQAPPLVPPSGDAGMDGVVINVAAMLAGAVTDPFGDGFYQGDRGAALEAATACAGVYGKGAYPGYPGELLVDSVTGASYNAHGAHGRKYLLPALFDLDMATCATLV